MTFRKETGLAPRREPFALLKEMTSELDRVFDEPFWPSLRWHVPTFASTRTMTWSPGIDVFQKDNRLITKIDLPGLKKEDVKIEVTEGYLAISGERKSESEEKKDNFYRCEREHGSFYHAVPLPAGARFEDVKATFSDGVLEVSVPVPAKPEAKFRRVQIEDATKAKTAA